MELTGSLTAVGYGLSAIGGGIGVGLIFAAYMTSVARQPESQRTLQPMLFLGFALVEALAVLGLVLAFIK
ncbi:MULTISPECIES: ATP synthase F0 subunit C [Rothia]|uniref:ATP synthase subunit c n=2 Tax=Rothia TaxID=32207 RepID=A0A4Y9F5B7_9MICC|nr:ATP synthase F0 subunit C [Rothia nasimurium]MDY3048720.1 ATP synthase F0 subunit C [Rothia sp. (in: high G+C Gram-positive bacteria)]HJD50437.1 ATP synthase F0 subunit C [Candidatus Rothia avistercoris]MBF0807612.1 ATP synthase F0 subunit C [Rothia nasimurium]MDY6051763.1 ATP synthase F0 subunit C [Rothia sp. (in: high G+C Gram-positive bacteria)]TFU23540.1 ATP synthase F0 subunit C [Rothia nasimurium]